MNNTYTNLEDGELLRRYGNGDMDAVECLLERYKNLVKKKARAMYLIGGDQDDLIQEGMIGLMKAARSYDSSQDTSFAHFAELCISRQIYSTIEASNRKKHIPLNSYISLFEENREEGRMPLLEIVESGEGRNPEELLIDRENAEHLDEELEQHLSGMERDVLNLYLMGTGYVQIADILGKTPKQIDNALQRIRGKLREIMKKQG